MDYFDSWGWCDFTAGWISGLAGIFVGHPADTMKVRQQTLQDLNPWGIIRNTYKYEGFRGFFKGMMFPALTAGLVNSIFFGLYGNSLRILQNIHGISDNRRTCAEGETPIHKYWHLDVCVAGCIGGFATVLVNCPIELIKIKLQSQTGTLSWGMILPLDVVKSRLQADNHYNPTYKGITDCIVKSYRAEGVRVFGRGFWLIITRAFIVNAAVFIGYEWSIDICQSVTDKVFRTKKI